MRAEIWWTLGVVFAIWLGFRWLRRERKPATGEIQANKTRADPSRSRVALEIAQTPRFIEERAAALSAPPVYRLEYIDADGVITRRDVTPSSWPGYEDRTNLWCHLRRDWRTFRYDRMSRIIRLSTGEVLQVEQLYSEVQHQAKVHERDRVGQKASFGGLSADAEECWSTYADVLTLAALVGKSDGRFVAKEKEMLGEFIVSRNHTQGTAEELLKRLGKVQMPTDAGVDRLLDRISKEAGESLRRDAWCLCQKMMDADGKLSEKEKDFLKRVEMITR